MPYTNLLIAVACAILFFRVAQYERMSAWTWAIASIGISLVVSLLRGGLALILLSQMGLFAVIWWYNAQRRGRP